MSIQYRLKALREKHAEHIKAIQKIGQRIQAEDRAMTTEERAEFERHRDQSSSIAEEVRAAERELEAGASGIDGLLGREDVVRSPRAVRDDRPASETEAEERALAFQAWARHQHGLDLTPAHQRAVKRAGVNPAAKEFRFILPKVQTRALSAVTGTAGAYTIPEGFSGAYDRALKAFGGVREAARIVRTATGNAMPYPTVDDTSNVGERLAENTEVTYQDPTFGVVNFSAYKYSSKAILAPYELMQDSAFDLEQLLGELAGERIGRAQGAEFTTGTGTSQPEGVVTGASAGITAASPTAIVATELVRLAHAVDPAYRVGPSVGYMMNDGILAQLALLVDSDGRPLLVPSWRDGPVARLYNFPIWTNMHMQATIATATVTVLFGDFSRYAVRDAGEVRLKRLDERWAEKDQVGFLAFHRSDGRYTRSAAVKKLTQA